MQARPERIKPEAARKPADAPLFRRSKKTSMDVVQETLTDELVIALCGPIGSPLHTVADRLQKIVVDRFHYKSPPIIRLSKYIEKHAHVNLTGKSHFERVMELIEQGNNLRQQYGPGILAELAIHDIHVERQFETTVSGTGRPHFKPRRVCHIINSIKNQEELNVLKVVYRDMLFCVGVLSPIELRVEYLQGRDLKEPEIYRLIDKDSGEEIPHGQTVRDTFPQADFFLRIGSRDFKEIDAKLERFLQIVLGTDVITPTNEEQAMYLAASASTNSACLSRQVGAAVTDPAGHVLGVGWNDVPKAGGGLYQSSPKPDHRCINMDGGICFNDLRKDKLRQDIADALKDSGVIRQDDMGRAITAMNGSKIRDLIEFSRSIHAEMHAIITASQKTGDRMLGGSLFCTTYPCHSCARHIVAAGIKNVFYIEPYRKSLAIELHRDAISESESETKKVRMLAFDGIAPNRYMELFKMLPNSRKKGGQKNVNSPRDAMQKSEVSLEALPVLEGAIVETLFDREVLERPQKPAEEPKNEKQERTQNSTESKAPDSQS